MNTEPDKTMQSIIEALETAPHVAVPDDFAARVMARLPRQSTRRLRMPALPARMSYGRLMVILTMLLLVSAMLIFAPRSSTTGNNIIQFALLAELGALTIWFGKLVATKN